MSVTPSIARRQVLPTAAMADRLLHLARTFDPLVRWYSGYVFWTLGILARQYMLGWKTSGLTGFKQGNCRGFQKHIKDGNFQCKWPPSGSPASQRIMRDCYLIETLPRQLAARVRTV